MILPHNPSYDYYPTTWTEIRINRYSVVKQESPPPEHPAGVAGLVDRVPAHRQRPGTGIPTGTAPGIGPAQIHRQQEPFPPHSLTPAPLHTRSPIGALYNSSVDLLITLKQGSVPPFGAIYSVNQVGLEALQR